MYATLRAGLTRMTHAPERLVRAVLGPPPRSDRGVELDLQTHALLRLMALARRGRLEQLSVARARREYQHGGALLDLPAPSLAERRDFALDGASGPLPARLYRPAEVRGEGLLLWFHGGGYVVGNLETHASACATLATRAGCPVVAVDYRKAPEHPFPSASDDGLAALRWLRTHAGELQTRPEAIAIGGDSAGANLSAGLCLRLRDAGEAQPRVQVLAYPLTQIGSTRPSRRHFGAGFMLSDELIGWFRGHYLRGPDDRQDPLLSPLLAARHDGLAPAIIHTAGFDPLRDEGQAYAEVLRAAGVEVDYSCHERLIHGYLTMGGVSQANRAAIHALADDLRDRLA